MKCIHKCQDGLICTRTATHGKKCWQHKKKISRSRSKSRSTKQFGGGGFGPQNLGPCTGKFPMPKTNGWTIYGWSSCPHTQRARGFLQGKHTFHDISNCMSTANKELLSSQGSNYTKVPRVFKDGKFIGGADSLQNSLKLK